MARIPLAVSKPEPGETDEEFAKRFAAEVMAALEAHRTHRYRARSGVCGAGLDRGRP